MSLIKRKDTQNRRREGALGSKRVSAYSYHNVRSEAKDVTGRDPSRSMISENKLSKVLNRVGTTIFLLICIICLVSILILSTVPRIVLVGGQGNNQLFNEYRQSFLATSKRLFASSLFNRDKITVNSNGIAAQLAKDYPEFSQVTIGMPLIGQHPVVYVTQSIPSLVLTSSEGRFLINNTGVAVLRLTGSNQFDSLPLLQDQSGLPINIGQPALTTDNVNFIETINYQLSAKNYKITSYVLPAGTSELDVHLSSLAYYVKFNLEDNNPVVQAGRFIATANYFKQNNINPSTYVDVRTNGRVYYK